jgi:hypothetical protein
VDRLTDTGEGIGLSGDLRYCITQATSGLDTITFGVTGTINLTRALPDLATSVTIAGPGANQLSVRRDTGGNYRIFTVTGAPTVVISGLTVANGRASFGAGIYVTGGALTLTNSILSGNQAVGWVDYIGGNGLGGGIYVTGGALTLTNSILSGNQAVGWVFWADGGNGLGGGIYVSSGTVSVNYTTVSNNQATGGNGVDRAWCSGANGGDGGGGVGGGIYVAAGTVSVNNSTLFNNQATGGNGGYGSSCTPLFGPGNGGAGGPGLGGGIYVAADAVQVFQNTLSANQSMGGNGGDGGVGGDWGCANGGDGGNGLGGGLVVNGGWGELQHSTLSANQATGGVGGSSCAGSGFWGEGSGGGLAVTAGTLRTSNTILAGNAATTTAPDISGNLGSQGHNLIGNSTGGSGFDRTDLPDVDPLLGPLQDNGGPTFTHALLFGSPAIDSGDDTYAPDWDQRGPGFLRIVRIIDIGAFEVQEATQTPGQGSRNSVAK